MNWEKFTNWLKNEMSGHPSSVDVQDIWQAISPQLDQLPQARRKNRRTIFWIIASGIFIVGIGGWLILQNQTMDQVHSQESKSENSREKSSFENDLPIKSKKYEPTSDAQHPEDLNLTERKEVPTHLNEKKSLASEHTADSKKSTDSFLPLKNSRNADSLKKSKLVPTQSVLSQDSTAEKTFGLNIPENQALPRQVLDWQPVNAGFSNTHTTLEKNISGTPDPAQDSIRKRKITAFNLLKPQNPQLIFVHPALPNPKVFYQAPSDQLITLDSVDNQKFVDKRWQVFAGFTGGLSYAQKTTQAKTAAFDDLLKLRESSESNLETTHLGFQLMLRHRSGWEFRTGLEQTRIVERFDYQNVKTEVEQILGIQALRIGLDNDTTAIYGQIPLTRTTDIRKRIYNSYELIDIPLILGYSRRFGKLNLGIQTGVLLNLSLQTKGQVLSDSLSVINLQSDQSNLFKPRTGLGYYLGLRFQRPLFRTLEWNISPFARFYPQDFSRAQNTISQKYRFWGLTFGLLYRF